MILLPLRLLFLLLPLRAKTAPFLWGRRTSLWKESSSSRNPVPLFPCWTSGGWFLGAYFLGGCGGDGCGINGYSIAAAAVAKSWALWIPLGLIISSRILSNNKTKMNDVYRQGFLSTWTDVACQRETLTCFPSSSLHQYKGREVILHPCSIFEACICQLQCA